MNVKRLYKHTISVSTHSANPNPQSWALCLLWESGSHSEIQVFSSFLGTNLSQESIPKLLDPVLCKKTAMLFSCLFMSDSAPH